MPVVLEEVVERLAQRSSELFFGKYRGVVTDNNDPEGLARIKVQVPAVMGETEVGWCLPALPFAGDGHGLVMLPEAGAMVWVEFEAGHVDFPIWTGCFFTPGQRPSPAGTGARLIASVKGHKLLLDDDGDTVLIEHSGGAKVELSMTAITLEVLGSKIEMGAAAISFNNGVVKIGPAGVALANGAMTLGVPPT
jgi:Type VI secretion system/phage-baseplate injector OB domain